MVTVFLPARYTFKEDTPLSDLADFLSFPPVCEVLDAGMWMVFVGHHTTKWTSAHGHRADAVSGVEPFALELLSGLFDKLLSGLNIFLNTPWVTLLIGKAHLHYRSRGTKWSHCWCGWVCSYHRLRCPSVGRALPLAEGHSAALWGCCTPESSWHTKGGAQSLQLD